MSWQAYVDTNLVGSGKIAKAAILGLAGGVWASSAGYTISPQEQQAIVNGFKDAKAVQESGVRVAGNKFFVIQATDGSIYGKKQADGVVLVKTNQAVLVAEYVAPVQAPEATPIVESLGDYLKQSGY